MFNWYDVLLCHIVARELKFDASIHNLHVLVPEASTTGVTSTTKYKVRIGVAVGNMSSAVCASSI